MPTPQSTLQSKSALIVLRFLGGTPLKACRLYSMVAFELIEKNAENCPSANKLLLKV